MKIVSDSPTFLITTSLYLAADSQPVDVQSFELASDMLDVVVDVSCIYGQWEDEGSVDAQLDDGAPPPPPPSPTRET